MIASDPPSLSATVRELLAAGKGILAADESVATITRRFDAAHIESSEETRNAYREMLVTAPGLSSFITGVILFDETLRASFGGVRAPVVLEKLGLIPGIKVDRGTTALAHFPGEKVTQGVDGLRERLAEYRRLGARFTKWRAVFSVGDHSPSHACRVRNASNLAQFAALCQEASLVPIVEPEVLMEGDHSAEACERAQTQVLDEVFSQLRIQGVALEGLLLKTSMVLSGSAVPKQTTGNQVAEATLRCLRRCVPAAVPGILFLSGGQSEVAASNHLNEICALSEGPWRLTFSYGRALQDSALKTWKGAPQGIPPAQAILLRRARCNALASQGTYSVGSEVEEPALASMD